MKTIYFQPKGINPKYCEVGTLLDSDPDYIHYLDEPCKVLLNEVKIVPKENVVYDSKKGIHLVINKT